MENLAQDTFILILQFTLRNHKDDTVNLINSSLKLKRYTKIKLDLRAWFSEFDCYGSEFDCIAPQSIEYAVNNGTLTLLLLLLGMHRCGMFKLVPTVEQSLKTLCIVTDKGNQYGGSYFEFELGDEMKSIPEVINDLDRPNNDPLHAENLTRERFLLITSELYKCKWISKVFHDTLLALVRSNKNISNDFVLPINPVSIQYNMILHLFNNFHIRSYIGNTTIDNLFCDYYIDQNGNFHRRERHLRNLINSLRAWLIHHNWHIKDVKILE
jgi:hypothetical protein